MCTVIWGGEEETRSERVSGVDQLPVTVILMGLRERQTRRSFSIETDSDRLSGESSETVLVTNSLRTINSFEKC